MSTFDIQAPALRTVSVHTWPRGWDAVWLGWQFGLGFASGASTLVLGGVAFRMLFGAFA